MVRVRESLPRNASGAVDAQAWHALICADHPELDAAALEIAIELIVDLDEPNLLCLLYTSPSPRDQRGSRMPSSA